MPQKRYRPQANRTVQNRLTPQCGATTFTAQRRSSRFTSRLLTPGLMLLVLLGLGSSSCSSRSDRTLDPINAESQFINGPADLENKQTNVKITVPEAWVSAGDNLRRSADIYASHPSREMYASVLSESKTVLSQFDLEDNAEQYRWLIEKELQDYEGSTRTGLERINGDPVVQYEIRGRVDGVPVVYLHTTVQGDDNYYQVVGWTTQERYSENKATLENIIESFQGA
ncbi:MAG: hypothetical protein AAFO83_13555 [Cyanobacteria bacterium J06607_13]